MSTLRTFSYGGGVQSTACLVLAAQGVIDFRTFLFANVGDDSENPGTLQYMEEYAKPYAAEHAIEIVEISKDITIYEHVTSDRRSIVIPVYMANGAPGNRQCTNRWKRDNIARWIRKHGVTPEQQAIVGLGISTDEYTRMRTDSGIAYITNEYPLIDRGLSRKHCMNIIADSGLPVPPKSSCWFCPYHRHEEWQTMKRTEPELFEQAVTLERRINEKRASMGKDDVYLHTSCNPLDQAVGLQYTLFQEEPCDSGYCFV